MHSARADRRTIGDYSNNSPMESSLGAMPIELLNPKRWTTDVECSVAIAVSIENLCRQGHRQSSLECLSPQELRNPQLQ